MTTAPNLDRVILGDLGEGIRCRDETHRSYSSDRRFDECGMRDHLLRLGKGIDYMGPEACVGSAVDAAICELIADGNPNVSGLVEAAIADMADPAAAAMWDRAPLIDKAKRLTDLWWAEVRPTYTEHGGVYATQLELHFDVDGIPYHVHIDVVMNDGTVIDLKTSEKRLPDRWADWSVQLTIYPYALHAVYGQEPGVVGYDGLIFANPPTDVRAWNPSATKPWYDRQRSTRTPAQLDAFREDVLRREEARRWAEKTGIYTASGRSGMEFICGRCPVKPACPSWAPFI